MQLQFFIFIIGVIQTSKIFITALHKVKNNALNIVIPDQRALQNLILKLRVTHNILLTLIKLTGRRSQL